MGLGPGMFELLWGVWAAFLRFCELRRTAVRQYVAAHKISSEWFRHCRFWSGLNMSGSGLWVLMHFGKIQPCSARVKHLYYCHYQQISFSYFCRLHF